MICEDVQVKNLSLGQLALVHTLQLVQVALNLDLQTTQQRCANYRGRQERQFGV